MGKRSRLKKIRKKEGEGAGNAIVIVLLCTLLLGTLIYSNTFYSSFHFDDTPSIVDNFAIRNIFESTGYLEFLAYPFYNLSFHSS